MKYFELLAASVALRNKNHTLRNVHGFIINKFIKSLKLETSPT